MEEDSESNLSVTVYEDQTELIYFTKSSRKHLLGSSLNKRSPLSSINKPVSRRNEPGSLPASTSTAEEANCKRRQSKPAMLASDSFSKLSDEIVLHIFQYLPKKTLTRLALVNTRFSRISLDESLWVRMDLGNKSLRSGAVGSLLSRGLIICRLAQAKIQRPIFDDTTEGIQFKLQYLDLSLASIDKVSLAQLLSTCRILKKLSLEQLSVDYDVCKEIAKNSRIEVRLMSQLFESFIFRFTFALYIL